jgi:MFS family permease
MANPDTPTVDVPLADQRSRRSALFIVFLVVFIDLLGFGIVLPLLPRIAETYAKQIFPQPAWMTGMLVGILMSCFSLMQFLFAPVWGRISDRVGRRPILLIGLFGSVVFYALFGYAISIDAATSAGTAMALFFAARIGAGISGATISTAQAVIADSTPPDKRKHGMALVGAAFGIGFTFGPLIGYGCVVLTDYLPSIGYAASAMSLIALILGLWLFPETRVFNEASTGRRKLVDWSAMRFALGNPSLGPVILTFFMASLGFGAMEVTLSLFLKDVFGMDEDHSFLFFAYIGLVLMLTQGLLYRRLASRVSEVTFMGLGIGFMAIGVTLMGAISYEALTYGPRDLWMQLLFVALTSAVVGFAFLTPSAQALVSRRTDSEHQGEILGVNQSFAALARIIGPVFGITLYKSTETHLLPYIAGAILLVLMLPMLPRIRRGG